MNTYSSDKELELAKKLEILINEAEASELEIASFSLKERSEDELICLNTLTS